MIHYESIFAVTLAVLICILYGRRSNENDYCKQIGDDLWCETERYLEEEAHFPQAII